MCRALNQRGFSIIGIMVGVSGILLLASIALFYRGQVFVAKLKASETEVKRLTLDNNAIQGNLGKERLSNSKALSFYQAKLNECLDQKECKVIVINGCPGVKIISDSKQDKELQALQEIWE